VAPRIILIKVLAYLSFYSNRALKPFPLSVRFLRYCRVFGVFVWLDTSLKLFLFPCSFSSRSNLSNKIRIKSLGLHFPSQISLLISTIKLSNWFINHPVLWARFYYPWTDLGTLKYIFAEHL